MSTAAFSPIFGFVPTSPLYFVLYMLLIWVPYIILIIYGQKLQSYSIMADVARYLNRLKYDAEQSRENLMSYLQRKGVGGDGQKSIESMIEDVTITPVDMDPVGIVKKMELILRTQEESVKSRIKSIMKDANEVERAAVANMLEIASALTLVYKVIRHYYLLGRKFPDNIYLLAQLQMILPGLVKQADAYLGAMGALEKSLPLGDGIGPMIVGKFMRGSEKIELDDETVYAEYLYKGRTVAFLKAKGPMASVGHVDSGLKRLLDGPYADVKAIIMIDAALKMEGEQSGEVAVGIGAAIGGIGVEKFNIEEEASRRRIPLYAVIVKESIFEAISVMTRAIAESAENARKSVLDLIERSVPEGEKCIVIGVGNTMGVAQ